MQKRRKRRGRRSNEEGESKKEKVRVRNLLFCLSHFLKRKSAISLDPRSSVECVDFAELVCSVLFILHGKNPTRLCVSVPTLPTACLWVTSQLQL